MALTLSEFRLLLGTHVYRIRKDMLWCLGQSSTQPISLGILSTGTCVLPVGIYEVAIVHRDSKFEKPDYDYYAAIRIRWRYTRVQLNDRRFRMASLDIIAKVEMTTPRARRLWLSLIKSEPLACCDAIKTCQTLQSIQCRISSGKGKELDARKSFTFFF